MKVVLIILFLVCIPCVGLVAVLSYFGFNLFGKAMNMGSCALAFEDVRAAVMRYVESHDGTMPNAATWQVDVAPYYKKIIETQKDLGPLKTMPPDGQWGCKLDDEQMTGIAFNADLSGKKLKDIENPYGVVLLFEIDKPAMNASAPYKRRDRSTWPKFFGQPREWLEVTIEGRSNFGNSGGIRREYESAREEAEGKTMKVEPNTGR